MNVLQEKLKGGKIVLTTVSIDVGIPYNYRVPIHLYFFSNESIYKLFERVKMTVKECSHYHMLQDPDFYLDRVLKRGKVPEEIKKNISIDAGDVILVPTNEVLVIAEQDS